MFLNMRVQDEHSCAQTGLKGQRVNECTFLGGVATTGDRGDPIVVLGFVYKIGLETNSMVFLILFNVNHQLLNNID